MSSNDIYSMAACKNELLQALKTKRAIFLLDNEDKETTKWQYLKII